MQGMPTQLLEGLQCLLRLPRCLVQEIFGNRLMNAVRLVAYPRHLELKVLFLRVVMYQVDAGAKSV